MARRSDHSREEIRDMALQAAERLINEQGYKGLSARKVATEIGYTVGTLYLVFRNQDEFILHINSRTLDELYQAMEQSLCSETAPVQRVHALCRAYYDYAIGHSSRWLLIFEHALADDAALPDWYRQRITRAFRILEQVLEPICSDQTERQIGMAARVLWSSVHGITMLAVTRKLDMVGVESVYELLDSLVENYLAGLTR